MQSNLKVTIESDDEVVYYCRSCHSLCVVTDDRFNFDDWDGSYCGKCGSSDIGECTIEEWLAEEKRRKDKRREIEWSK